jgi:predicted DsbA family dithiol-disulfide isomerase
MPGKKFYIGLALATLIVALVDVTYFSQLAVAEPSPEPSEEVSTAQADASVTDNARDAPAPTPTAPTLSVAPRASAECVYDPGVPAVADYEQLVNFSDPFEGTASSGVQVLEFFDPNCPHCRTMHPIMRRVIETHGDRAQFFMVPFIVFPQSMPQIEALYVAAQDGKFSEMLDAQFANQKAGGLSVAELAALAGTMGIDSNVFATRVGRGLNQASIISRRQQISGLGVSGVPTVMINGRIIASTSKTVSCLQEMITAAAPTD